MRLLYVADGRPDAYLLKALREAGHVVDATDEAADAVEAASASEYQAIILDGPSQPLAATAALAKAAAALILVVVPAADETLRTEVLHAGADACFVRPLAFIELEARLDALARLLQRRRATPDGVEMLEAERAVRLGHRVIALSPREFRVMAYLAQHAGEVVALERLQQQAWSEDAEPRLDLVRACLSRLRRKLDAGGGAAIALRAVEGHGYLLQP
jgi:two-component system OmpR family response regulator